MRPDLFLYQAVLERKLAWLGDLVHAKRPLRLPVVLTRGELQALLRLREALHLGIKDVDLEQREILVRDGKDRKDRRTVLPEALIPALRQHIAKVRAQHDADLARSPWRRAPPR